MKGHPLCIPCTVRAAYDISAKATNRRDLQEKVVVETLKWLSENHNLMNLTPATLHTYIFRLVQKITGNTDPFSRLKRESNSISLSLIPLLKSEFEKRSFKDAFRFAALGAICGNSIDFEVEGYSIPMEDLQKALINCLKGDLAIDDTPKLMDALSKAEKVVYLLDNAGEVAFDKFFIKVIVENYPVKVSAAVKAGPILNDAMVEDAAQVGLSEVAEVITTGSDSIGLNLNECSGEFLRRLHDADLIISKGQGYYESLTEVESFFQKPVTYMLRAKCSPVAESLGVRPGENVVKFIV